MLELLTSEQMSEADRLTIKAGISGFELMERAGKVVAKCAAKIFEPKGTILIVCGPGNNGGDGFVAARLLQEQGFTIRLTLLGTREDLKGDAALAADSWSGPIASFNNEILDGASGIIDALFGAGLTRDLTGPAAEIITAINEAGLPVLSVDLPSGIDGSNGQICGIAVRATRTISFFRRKPVHVLFPGREFCGPVEIGDIGISAAVLDDIRPQSFCNECQ